MKNLLPTSKKIYDKVVLAPHERWERSKQVDEVTVKYDDHGHEVYAPVFDVGLAAPVETLGRRDFGDRQNPAGSVYADVYRLNDGMTRYVQTWIPHDMRAEFTATSGMAFTTMVPGYDQDRAEWLAHLGIPNIQISAEQGDKHWPGIADIKRLGHTALHAHEISIAKSSQAETEIIADAVSRYGLPRLIEAHGDSRGSMTSIGRAVYSELKNRDGTSKYDLSLAWIDPKAVVMHDRLPAERLHKLVTWLGKEAIGSPQVIAELAAQGKLLSLRGTVSLNPNFLLASTIGVGPALFSGETGALLSMLPGDTRGFANGYVRDELFDQDNWREGLRAFPNFYLNVVNKGVHAHLLSIRGLQRQMGRFDRLAEQSREHGANLAAYDVPYIAGRTQEQIMAQSAQFTSAA